MYTEIIDPSNKELVYILNELCALLFKNMLDHVITVLISNNFKRSLQYLIEYRLLFGILTEFQDSLYNPAAILMCT